MSEEPKKEEIKPKEECPKKEGCHGFHGFGPRCHWRGPMGPGMHPHKHKERKCECGEIIPKRKQGEPKIKVCPKCGKDLPKKQHGFGMRCHKMRKFMKYMFMMKMMNTWGGPFGFGFGPRFNRFGAPSPYRGFDVHHYIHFGPPMHPPCFGRPPMGPFGFGRPPMHPPCFRRPPMGPFGFGRPPMGPPYFGRPPMGPFGFGRPPMGPPGFSRTPMGPWCPPFGAHGHHRGRHGPCEKKDEKKE